MKGTIIELLLSGGASGPSRLDSDSTRDGDRVGEWFSMVKLGSLSCMRGYIINYSHAVL